MGRCGGGGGEMSSTQQLLLGFSLIVTQVLRGRSRKHPKTTSHPSSRLPNLVEKQGLADIAPTAGSSSCGEKSRKQAHEKEGPTSGPRTDEEHHQEAGGHPKQAGVPGEQAEGGAGMGRQREEHSGLALNTCPSLALVPRPPPRGSLLPGPSRH